MANRLIETIHHPTKYFDIIQTQTMHENWVSCISKYLLWMFTISLITCLKFHLFLINDGIFHIDDKAWLHNGMCIALCCNASYSHGFYWNRRRWQLFLSDCVLHLLKMLMKWFGRIWIENEIFLQYMSWNLFKNFHISKVFSFCTIWNRDRPSKK